MILEAGKGKFLLYIGKTLPDTIEYLVYFSRQNLSFFRETSGEVNIRRVVREVEGAALEIPHHERLPIFKKSFVLLDF